MSEMKKSLEAFKLQQNLIQESINRIQKPNIEIAKSMKFMEKHYEEMKDYIQTLESKVEILKRSQ